MPLNNCIYSDTDNSTDEGIRLRFSKIETNTYSSAEVSQLAVSGNIVAGISVSDSVKL